MSTLAVPAANRDFLLREPSFDTPQAAGCGALARPFCPRGKGDLGRLSNRRRNADRPLRTRFLVTARRPRASARTPHTSERGRESRIATSHSLRPSRPACVRPRTLPRSSANVPHYLNGARTIILSVGTPGVSPRAPRAPMDPNRRRGLDARERSVLSDPDPAQRRCTGGGPLCSHTGYVRELANQITKTRP